MTEVAALYHRQQMIEPADMMIEIDKIGLMI